MTRSMVVLGLLLGVALLPPAHAGSPDPELGRVRWGRDLDAALTASRHSGRPVLVLFDEVPGCATCQGFGQQVLAQPLIAEAIESEFEPVFVANCRPGHDADVLARYDEPAWNNPVIRFLDASGHDVIPRLDGLYSARAIVARMTESLTRAGRPVPSYLTLALDENHLATQHDATFAMGCFWEGEARLGGIEGVVATEPGNLDGREVVTVTYDETRLPFARLLAEAERLGCTDRVWVADAASYDVAHARLGSRATRSSDTGREAAAEDRKHTLARSPLRALELSPMQATHVNAALAAGTDPLPWLSPRQRAQATELGFRLAATSPGAAACRKPTATTAKR